MVPEIDGVTLSVTEEQKKKKKKKKKDRVGGILGG